ncbi:uncharacterized protein JCM15063_004108 [Sporobolomyces koalae]|uniref:uncharacterized protein n=1 Tax=Sporobolomyces koalae TaxID=500713 RepID=UPI003170421D
MSGQHQSLLEGVLGSLTTPIADHHISTLAAIVGHDLLKDALDLVDRDQVVRVNLPNGNKLYQVAGSSGTPYNVLPELAGGYCPCPAYSLNVLARATDRSTWTGSLNQCKHLLACRLADKVPHGWNDKTVSMKWVAGYSTGFGLSAPNGLKGSSAATTERPGAR